ncbi:MAG: UvrD-helicase domain-containing protein, partial [Longimicrobiales bacterium]
VGTLDSFFVRVAGSFALELGLPRTWSIADEPSSARLESEALEDILESTDRDEVLELIRALAGVDATRSVRERILDHARELRSLLHQIDPRARRPWHPFTEDEPPPDREERNRVAERIERLRPPSNKDGTPNKSWRNALEAAAVAVREGDWDSVLGKGVGSKILEGETEFSRNAIEPRVREVFEEALELARRAIRADLDARSRALGTLAQRFDAALDTRQRRAGSFRFDDVTRMLGGTDPLSGRSDLWYRLDQRARHLLLDEFQDTSLLQWEALKPLAEEILSGHAGERAAVIVADPKQSIYGWRGAEPELVHRVGQRFVLDRDRLRLSYRSSSRVLDFVNRIFGDMDRRSIWDDVPEDRTFVRDWLEDFEPHEAARALPGRVRLEVGPREESMRSDDRPLMMRRAAERIAGIRGRAPDFTVGALLRKNRNVPLLIAELRARGIEASEEGGTLLTDSPAVTAVLALLRLADHPGHTISRYHVARSPLGPRLGLDTHEDPASARALSRRVRRRLVHDGYGLTLDAWAEMLTSDAALGTRDHRRIAQLVELGFAWDGKSPTLRPGDFVRFVETEKVEDPTAAAVRVMTVHQAKGLEFDVVVLPELDLRLVGGGGRTPAALPERDSESGRILRIFPYVKSDARELVPEAEPAVSEDQRAALRDALGVLYVGMTRARFSLHLLVAADPDGGPTSASTFARLLREALDAHEDPVSDGDVLFEEGTDDWPERVPDEERRPAGHMSPPEPLELDVHLASRGSRRRILPHRSPSELEGGEAVRLSDLLSLDEDGSRASARRRGIVVHEWCRRIGWLEDGLPGPDRLLSSGRRAAPEMSEGELRSLRDDFFGWLEFPEVRRVLSRDDTAHGEEDVQLEREWPFAVRRGDEIVEGIVDRLVLFLDGDGRVVRARILDFKTDRVESGKGRRAPGADPIHPFVERYRPQLEAYRDAVSRAHAVESAKVEALLVFLPAGRTEPL